MIVYLAAIKPMWKKIPNLSDYYILTSFYEWHMAKKLPDYVYWEEKHIADSGAFSTFKDINEAKNLDWDGYVKKYINFLKETKSKLFFELDIDAVVGLNKVEYYRNKIEDAIGIPPIPVWHKERKWEYYQMMCEKYPYVALGTTKANPEGVQMRAEPQVLKTFIDYAHEKGAKIHGLGFTSTKWLKVLNFDSVDSTSWNSAQYGSICQFTGQDMKLFTKPAGMRLKGKTSDYHVRNFLEWGKYQKYKLNK